MTQGTLFDGPDIGPRDNIRLKGQLQKVRDFMADGAWRTLAEIAGRVSGSEAGVSARLRDLRKQRFGSFHVERRRRAGHEGLWEYRVLWRKT